MKINIPKTEIKKIMIHSEEAYPEECCGILVGKIGEINKIIETKRMRNTNSGSRNTRYNIDPIELLKLEDKLDEEGMLILGIYHSHPNFPAKPSKFDLDRAWPNLSYTIISVNNGKSGLLTSWRLDQLDRKFTQEEIIIQ